MNKKSSPKEDKINALRQDVRKVYDNYTKEIFKFSKSIGHFPMFLVGPPAPTLTENILSCCRLLPKREDIISNLKPGGIGVEVGTRTGAFARKLIDLAKPKEFYTIDQSYDLFKKDEFKTEFKSGLLSQIEGCSWDELNKFPSSFFDWIYIDAGHDYESVTKDLSAAHTCLKDDGLIICNDFTNWSPFENAPYGVYRSVCEFALEHEYEIVFMALQGYGYHDVALKKKNN